MININEIMLKLGIGQKETVYMSVSPIAGLEIINVDTQSKTVSAYANRPLEYNETLRNIADYDAFKTAVHELFKELQINPFCNVVLNIPTVLFARKEVPLILDDDAVKEFLISEAEQTYTFKRHDPLISWTDAKIGSSNETRSIFYSAIQKDVIDNIKNALSELGATLVSVNTSFCSIINALSFSDHTSKMMKDNLTWNLIFITTGGYSICAMQGTNIVDYYDEPLALKSYEDDELYRAIVSSLQITLMNYPANSSYIVSNTNIVSAEILSSRLKDADIPAVYLENNTYRKEGIIPASLEILPDLVPQISLEAVGTAISNQHDLPVKMDFMAGLKNAVDADDNSPIKFTIGENEYEVTRLTAVKISVAVSLILILPVVLLLMIFSTLSTKLQTNLDTLNEELKKIEAEVKTYSEEDSQSNSFNEKQEILKTVKSNRSKLMAYSALGETVPENLWITYFYTRKDGQMDIKGAALSVEDISIFYKNLKDTLINSKIRLYKLEIASNNIDDAVTNTKQSYLFEITNMSESELSAKNSPGTQQETNAENKQEQVKSKEKDVTKSSSSKSKKQKKSKTKSSGAKKNEQSVPDNLPQGLE